MAQHELEKLLHVPLRERHYIRLLKIQRAKDFTDNIHCELEEWDPSDDSCPDYEALSWCWGEEGHTSEITIKRADRRDPETRPGDTGDGYGRRDIPYKEFSFDIRETLFNALKALRQLGGQERYLWVDHICINQLDIEERNHQVSRMSEIYGHATSVCIWLGESYEDSDEALDFIRYNLSKPYQLDRHCTRSEYLSNWVALKYLMKRPWFSRRWIVQEVALAQRATINCGLKSLEWDEFKSAISIMVHSQATLTTLVENSPQVVKDKNLTADDIDFSEIPTLGATRLVEVTDRLFKRNAGNRLQLTSGLEEVVAWLPMFETGEPRDVVYALLALAKDTQPTVNFVPNFIQGRRLTEQEKAALKRIAAILPKLQQENYEVKYDQPVVDVYQQFIAFAMRKSGNPAKALDIICRPFAKEYTREQDCPEDKRTSEYNYIPLPSWMPNALQAPWVKQWQPQAGERDNEQPAYKYERERGDPFVSVPDSISYYSAADLKVYNYRKTYFRRRRDHYSLFVEGFVLDEVQVRTQETSQRGTVPADWIKLGEEVGGHAGLKAFTRTLVADRGPNGVTQAFYEATLAQALSAIEANGSLKPDIQAQKSKSSQVKEVMNHVISTISGRKLIKTKHFQLLGLAPKAVETGDLICILYGCSVPVILRRANEKNIADDEEDDAKDLLARRQKSAQLLKKWLQRPGRLQRRRNDAASSPTAPIVAEGETPEADADAGAMPIDDIRADDTREATELGSPQEGGMQELSPTVSLLQTTPGVTLQRSSTGMIALGNPDFVPIMFRASILCLSALAGSRWLGGTVIACLLVLLCSIHYIADMVPGRPEAAHILVFIASPFFIVVLVSGMAPFTAAAFVATATVLLYPELLPDEYRKFIPWYRERALPARAIGRSSTGFESTSTLVNDVASVSIPNMNSNEATATTLPGRETIVSSTTSMERSSSSPGLNSPPRQGGLRRVNTTSRNVTPGSPPASQDPFTSPSTPRRHGRPSLTASTPRSLHSRSPRAANGNTDTSPPADPITPTSTSAPPLPNGTSSTQGQTSEQARTSRSHETHKYAYTLIGECYIDTMMTGEAITKQNESVGGPDRMLTVTFELR